MIRYKNQRERELNEALMKRFDASYDAEKKMVTSWRGEHGYHSTLVNQQVHPIRDSFLYAYELLNRGEAGDISEAGVILSGLLPLQDQNPEHDTYGIWAYFLEESLEEMAPPDWNWADFCGKVILQILFDHAESISEELKQSMEQALFHACNSIRRRDMGPHYTNISIMGTLVTMAASEYFEDADLNAYARARLENLHQFNIRMGAFQEYNSPSYTWVVLEDLAAMLPYIRDPQCRSRFEDMNKIAWQTAAEHFHYPTKQWSGPHARFYQMLEDPVLLMRIQRALDYQVSLVDINRTDLAESLPYGFFSVDSKCPEEFWHYFTGKSGPRETAHVYIDDKAAGTKEIGVSYQQPEFSMGTFYKATFWNQVRSHITYFGTAERPVYCGLKCLHDFYDYSSGLIATAQDKGRAVSVIGFGRDGGDTHPNLDPLNNGTIKASDLRIRFEVGGAVETITVKDMGAGEFAIEAELITIHITIPFAAFGQEAVRFVLTKEEEHINETGDHKNSGAIYGIDIILYQGPEKEIDFADLDICCCAIAYEVLPHGAPSEIRPQAAVQGNTLQAFLGDLKVTAPIKSVPIREFRQQAKAYRGDAEYGEIAF